jgi:hypothetical protein
LGLLIDYFNVYVLASICWEIYPNWHSSHPPSGKRLLLLLFHISMYTFHPLVKEFEYWSIIFFAVNVPLRDYQFHITQTALFQNTLVALPTGLGKTLIAAVVMFNYFRWFPEGNATPWSFIQFFLQFVACIISLCYITF